VSPQSRCALTTPFHHCPKGLLFSVALSLKSPPLGFLQHPVSKTLGLSSLTGSPCPRDRITVLKSKAIIYQTKSFVKFLFFSKHLKKEKAKDFY